MRTAIIITSLILITIITAAIIRLSTSKKSDSKPKYLLEKSQKTTNPGEIKILQSWELPGILKEISAIAYLDENNIACVQDEVGKIFIYNIKTKKIVKEIPFGESGDYEGLAINASTAYVLRADGQLFEIFDFMDNSRKVIEHKTSLTHKQNTEGLAFDKKNNRLLIAIRGSEPDDHSYKGIYSFNLNTHTMENAPVFKIDLENAVFEGQKKGKKKGVRMQPSEIAIHPQNGNIFITDGAKPKLLIMSKAGKIISVKELNVKEFPQPEGITFSPDGRLFISNEGTKQAGNILEVDVSQ